MNTRVALLNVAELRCAPLGGMAGVAKPLDRLAIIVIDGLRSDFAIGTNRSSGFQNIPLMKSLQAAAFTMVC